MLFFFEQTQSDFAFHCIEKVCEYMPPRRLYLQGPSSSDQWTSQEAGKTTRSPCAPAFALHLALSLILSTSASIDGLALSKTHSFLCFQIIQGTSSVIECRALCSVGGVCAFARIHQSIKVVSLAGVWAGMCVQSRVRCQICLANGHVSSRCWMVSGS